PTNDDIRPFHPVDGQCQVFDPRCDALHGGRIAGADRLVIARNPLRTGLGEADVTLALGECDENASGPGVSCVAAIKRNPNAAPIDRVIGFAKSASGEWVATNY
ncbi:MAG: hypothetical protein KJ843_19720, partial [Alphaproteobacteria bacterium]|nr:hypothetical protein [Alphaproteobacteria bacterium]